LEILVGSDPEAAQKCIDQAVMVLSPLRRSQQAVLLAEAIGLADMPQVAAAFFCCGAEPVYRLREQDLRDWIGQGRDIGRTNPTAAVAFFRLESRAGLSALRKFRQTVHLGEVIGVLQLYSSAMAEKSIGIKCVTDAPSNLVRENQPYPLTDGRTIFLPETLDKHPTYRANFEEYKVLAAHQAGYIEFGTFDLDLEELREHPALSALPWSRADAWTFISHYGVFFHLFDDPMLARDTFFAVEDGRVDFLLARKYRGLAPHLDQVALESLKGRPDPSTLPLLDAAIEVLILCSVRRQFDGSLPEPWQPFAEKVMQVLSRVFTPGATVTDSAAATVRIYELISNLSNLPPELELTSDVFDYLAKALYERQTRPPSIDPDRPDHHESTYRPARPVFYRGRTNPEQVQLELAVEILRELNPKGKEITPLLSADILKMLLKQGAKIALPPVFAELSGTSPGLILNDLDEPVHKKNEKAPLEEEKRRGELYQRIRSRLTAEADRTKLYYYDEWDYLIGDYRPRWCTVREFIIEGESSEMVNQIQKQRADLISSVRRQFQRIRPDRLRRVKRLPTGDDIDLDSAIEAVIERRVDLTPSERIYQRRERRTRDVATAFLLDLSASTRKSLEEEPDASERARKNASNDQVVDSIGLGAAETGKRPPSDKQGKRVVDIEREALIVMAEALEGLGDEYAIYGFSSYGRNNVEFLIIKDFSEHYNERVRSRVGALRPRTSTRMGPAIRHAQTKLAQTGCRLKVLILLSDGYPQDFGYGPDPMGHEYGVHDTMVALTEARRKNIYPFMVTVDLAGNDYLFDMCAGDNYLVVKRPSELPDILPRIYRGLTV
jgi:putative component of toxin-antitoxin plasmid stabilization module